MEKKRQKEKAKKRPLTIHKPTRRLPKLKPKLREKSCSSSLRSARRRFSRLNLSSSNLLCQSESIRSVANTSRSF